jgi:hypothetical protein
MPLEQHLVQRKQKAVNEAKQVCNTKEESWTSALKTAQAIPLCRINLNLLSMDPSLL